ncbi:hypothetical protein ACOME3_002380 [Neoechinorhynchus agilis]
MELQEFVDVGNNHRCSTDEKQSIFMWLLSPLNYILPLTARNGDCCHQWNSVHVFKPGDRLSFTLEEGMILADCFSDQKVHSGKFRLVLNGYDFDNKTKEKTIVIKRKETNGCELIVSADDHVLVGSIP